MPLSEKSARYSLAAMTLHWLIAAALVFQMGMGWRLAELAPDERLFEVAQLHKSVGITILLLSIIRLVVRFYKPPPPALPDEKWAHSAAKWTHVALYMFMIGAPLAGWLMVSASKLNIDTMLFGTVPWPHIPGVADLAADTKEWVYEGAKGTHKYMSWIGSILLVMHVGGALRHQFLKSEPLLARMLTVGIAEKRIAGTAAIGGIFALLLGIATAAYTQIAGNGSTATPRSQPVAAEAAAAPDSADQDTQSTGTNAGTEQGSESRVTTETDTVQTTESREVEAQETTTEPEPPEPKPVPNWTITQKDPIRFSVAHNGNQVRGRFSSWDADIVFSPEALGQSRIAVTVDLGSADAGEATTTDMLRGQDFFAVSSFPQARFVSSRISSLGGNRYEASGTLTLKNISRPVRLLFKLDINGSDASASGTAGISRSAHQVGVGDYADIADDVSVSFSLSARR